MRRAASEEWHGKGMETVLTRAVYSEGGLVCASRVFLQMVVCKACSLHLK